MNMQVNDLKWKNDNRKSELKRRKKHKDRE